ncbi:hypothetical protein L915_04727 [Phytophthora nicotianae]|uniref:Uncharacterized protein n=3 Tax=Phytophthora nicotianae TaxID=4792 RepID=V9FN49_PHYNI|nr:hypothetical protein F443_04861 [Phytophthora nicotianae P1569]ETK91736.1 hypothetical protein L915_04727 [Phytophthora nicotianae]ETL45149.1 hypothetical protein L916_04689 [Phytophthora nicotianae]ETO80599.1 hypothetical protein F444_04899 [Phytophthora nicotianae P1976]
MQTPGSGAMTTSNKQSLRAQLLSQLAESSCRSELKGSSIGRQEQHGYM